MAKSSYGASAGFAAALVGLSLYGQIAQAPSDTSATIGCERRLQRVAEAHGLRLQPGDRLLSDREGRLRRDSGAPEVRMHYLVDRQIGGCPVPVVSSTYLEEANRAVGRTVGREAGPRR